MSTNDKIISPGASKITSESSEGTNKVTNDDICEKKEKKLDRKVCFPLEHLVTQSFAPANPWLDVPFTTRAQLATEYLESCRCHGTEPIQSVLEQLKDLPENTIGGGARASRLLLSFCSLLGTPPVDALEAIFRKVQFRRIELENVDIDDEGAEALFDMVEYYESSTAVCILGTRQFGIRGWQSACRMIKNSVELSELEVSEGALEPTHANVLSRALKPMTCRLRTLCLQRAMLSGEPLLCIVKALKTNSSVRELRLGDNGLLPDDAAHIANLLKYNSRIHLLDLSNNPIQDEGVGHLSEAIFEEAASSPPEPMEFQGGYESRGLAFLVLWNNQLTKNCYISLLKILQSPSLRVLNIGCNALGCETLRLLQMDKAVGGTLVSLGLQAARLGPDSAKYLAALIKIDNKLQRLDLRDNKLGMAGLQAILNAMKENNTMTQIDLDDPVEGRESVCAQACTEAATVSRLLRDIRSVCRRNEPVASAPPDRLLRKISLTCHAPRTPHAALTPHHKSIEEERRGRLRSPAPSPAPSPAGSPTPHGNSRFSVTRVTPDRDSSDSSNPSTPTRPTSCSPSLSRFKVVQVVEPQIPAPLRKPSSSRFSVTRNYDSIYNPKTSNTKSDHESNTLDKSKQKFNVKQLSTDIPMNVDSRIYTADTEFVKERNPTIVIRSEDEDDVFELPVVEINKELEPDVEKCKTTFNKTANVDRPLDCETKVEIRENEQCDDTVIFKECVVDSNIIVGFDIDGLHNIKMPKPVNEPVINLRYPEMDGIKNDVILQTDAMLEFGTCPAIKVDINHVEESEDVQSSNPSDFLNKNSVNSDINKVFNFLPSDTEGIAKVSECKIVHDTNICMLSSEVINFKKFDGCYNNKIQDSSQIDTFDVLKDDKIRETELKLVKSSVSVLTSESEKVENEVNVSVKNEVNSSKAKVLSDQNVSDANIGRCIIKDEKCDVAMKQIEAITEDLGNLIQQMHDLSTKTRIKHAADIGIDVNIVSGNRDNVVLKKNKSESSLDSPDLEVSRLMRKPISAFCDSSSSLEISGSSVESLNIMESRIPKPLKQTETRGTVLSTESSMESTSEVTPVNLNMSVSSNESVSPIIFGGTKKIHGSLSSLEASVSSLDSARQEKLMVTSADSGIEYSLQHPSEAKEDSSSNEGTLTYSSSSKDPVQNDKDDQDTLTSPKRTSSLLDVPAFKSKGLDRVRKISWVAPSASFHIPKPEEKVEIKLQTNLEKLLSLFQHPSSLFSRNSSDDEKKSASNTPPRKDSSLTSSFWSWGGNTEKVEKDDKDTDSMSEATDSTLSERIQVSFVDESFSKKLDSKTPSTDTDNTLSEFQTFPNSSENVKVTDISTDENLVQNNLALSVKNMDATSDGCTPGVCDNIDLNEPNDLVKDVCDVSSDDSFQNINKGSEVGSALFKLEDETFLNVRSRSFASVLKASCSENSQEKENIDTGQPIDKIPPKIIKGIKENVSPENTLTSSITTALVKELYDRRNKNKPIDIIPVDSSVLEKSQIKAQLDLAPIAVIDEMSDVAADDCIQLAYIDDTSDECRRLEKREEEPEPETVDLGKDALSYLSYEKKSLMENPGQGSLAEELREAQIKELLDLSPELVIDEAIEIPEVFSVEVSGRKSSPVVPERAKVKKANSLEDLTKLPALEKKSSPKIKTIAFKVPESTTPRDIPERRRKLRTRSGSSPKSLPESLNKPCPFTKIDSLMSKKKKKVSSLGKMARDSLLALNMSEEEIAEFRRSYTLTSVESLRSLESVSEDANSQSGTSADSRCRSCLRTSQESLMSLDSITEDCRCLDECEKRSHR